ncbi:MAG TPA: DUF4331 family protein [Gemmatimonadales bacterium]|nr:DUF4331 family protein [Gemmatimonadales bacterium]
MPPRPTRLAGVAVVGLAGLAATLGPLGASDHQDTPDVELNPAMDLTDVYAFPGSAPGRIALAMNTRAFLTPAQTPGATFDPNLLYQFKVDNDGDAVEDRVIQVTFRGTGADQRMEVRGPIAPPVEGAMMNVVADGSPDVDGPLDTSLDGAGGLQAFAGARDDSFFLDLEAAFCILPDRKPVTGPLSGPCALPGGAAFRPAGEAVNYVAGFNALSIVVELPSALLEDGAPGRLGIWGTVSR